MNKKIQSENLARRAKNILTSNDVVSQAYSVLADIRSKKNAGRVPARARNETHMLERMRGKSDKVKIVV